MNGNKLFIIKKTEPEKSDSVFLLFTQPLSALQTPDTSQRALLCWFYQTMHRMAFCQYSDTGRFQVSTKLP